MTHRRWVGGTAVLMVAALIGLATLDGRAADDAKSVIPADAFAKSIEADAKMVQEALKAPKPTKGMANRAKALSLLIAQFAHTGGKGELRDKAAKVVEALESDDLAAARTAAADLSGAVAGAGSGKGDLVKLIRTKEGDNIDLLMHIFKSVRSGGLDIEKDLKAIAEQKKPNIKDFDKLVGVGYKTAAAMQLMEAVPPKKEGSKDPKDWLKWAAGTREASLEMAAAAKKKDAVGVHKAVQAIDANCTECHNKFKN
jgi:hypothetical protein